MVPRNVGEVPGRLLPTPYPLTSQGEVSTDFQLAGPWATSREMIWTLNIPGAGVLLVRASE